MTGRVDPPRHSAATTMLLLACLALTASAHGQAKPAAANTITANPPAFEVVSVKLSKPGCDNMVVSSPPGRFSAHCTTLMGLLFNAYPTVKPSVPIPGLPGWANSIHFDVDAKTDDETAVAIENLPREEQWKQTQAMLQEALAGRFKLRTHIETREGPIYELVVAKGGCKLKNAPADEHSRGYSWGRNMIQIRTGPIATFVFALSDNLSRTVVDKTGLTGNFDIDLKWTPDDQQGTPDAGPTLFTALEEQLGLKLVPAKGPVDTFVVDHVERPTEN